VVVPQTPRAILLRWGFSKWWFSGILSWRPFFVVVVFVFTRRIVFLFTWRWLLSSLCSWWRIVFLLSWRRFILFSWWFLSCLFSWWFVFVFSGRCVFFNFWPFFEQQSWSFMVARW
jgi:hypothetical protein